MKKQTSATSETQVKGKTFIDYKDKILYVGIDVHKKDWQVAIVHEGVTLGSHRMTGSADVIITHLNKHYPGAAFRCVYETSAWGFNLQRALTAAGMSCIVVHAADVPGTNKDASNKTDKVDALKLARHHAGGFLRGIHVPDERLQKQRNLIRFRKKLVGDLQRSRNRIKSLLKFQGIDIPVELEKSGWSNKFILWLEDEAAKDDLLKDTMELMLEEMKGLRNLLLKTEKKLRALMNEAAFASRAKLVMSVAGVGRTTAMLLLLELGDVNRFKTFDQLNSFVGFYPGSYSSGEKSKDTGISRRQNRALRNALVESAWTSIRTDPAMLEAFLNLRKRMEPNKAIIRIARKLLRRIRTVILHNQPYVKGVVS